MISYEQFISDIGDFLADEGLKEKFLTFVAKEDKENYKELIEGR